MPKPIFVQDKDGTHFTIEGAICIICGSTDNRFKDAISVKEYGISMLCQACQDEVFKDDE